MAATPQSQDNSGYLGAADAHTGNSDFNQVAFVARQILARAATTTLVQVKAVTNSGGVSAVGFVDVQPMVHQIDGKGQATPHGTIHHLPYFRLQGGKSAIIIDPEVGDIGMACFASHDISSVKANRKASNPGSRRRFDWADGLYIGGMLNGLPEHYVRVSGDGIDIKSSNNLTIDTKNVTIDADGNMLLKGDLHVLGGSGDSSVITVSTHRHLDVASGTAESGPPKPGS